MFSFNCIPFNFNFFYFIHVSGSTPRKQVITMLRIRETLPEFYPGNKQTNHIFCKCIQNFTLKFLGALPFVLS